MLFDTNKANINQIKGAIKALGPVYFHGDGNIYAVNEGAKMYEGDHPSDLRKKHSNKKNSAYRVKFNSVNEVPDTVDDLNELLLRSFNNEMKEAAKPTQARQVTTFSSEDETILKSDPKKDSRDDEIAQLKAQLAAKEQENATLAQQLNTPVDKSEGVKTDNPGSETDANSPEKGKSNGKK